MPGPMPKDPKIRQRRNVVSTSSTLDGDAGTRKRMPSLASIVKRNWHGQTLAWWRDVWHSPMAAEFLEADRHALVRLAVLIDAFWNEPSKELAAEIRLEQQAFGLTPIDRRRLQWSIEPDRETERRPSLPTPETSSESDPRNLLTWVVAPETEPNTREVE